MFLDYTSGFDCLGHLELGRQRVDLVGDKILCKP